MCTCQREGTLVSLFLSRSGLGPCVLVLLPHMCQLNHTRIIDKCETCVDWQLTINLHYPHINLYLCRSNTNTTWIVSWSYSGFRREKRPNNRWQLKIWVSHSCFSENSSLLGCYTVSNGKYTYASLNDRDTVWEMRR